MQSSTNNEFNGLVPDPTGSTLTVHSKARNLNPANVKTTLNPPPVGFNSLLPPPSNRDRPLSDTKCEENILTVNESYDCDRIKSKLAPPNLNSHSKAMKVQDGNNHREDEDDEYGTKKMHLKGAKHHKKVHKVMAQSPPP